MTFTRPVHANLRQPSKSMQMCKASVLELSVHDNEGVRVASAAQRILYVLKHGVWCSWDQPAATPGLKPHSADIERPKQASNQKGSRASTQVCYRTRCNIDSPSWMMNTGKAGSHEPNIINAESRTLYEPYALSRNPYTTDQAPFKTPPSSENVPKEARSRRL